MTRCHHRSIFVFMIVASLSTLGAAQDLTVVTDAAVYNLGATVEITIHNPTDHNVDITSSPYFGIVHVETPVVFQYDTSWNPDPVGYFQVVVFESTIGSIPPPPPPTVVYRLIDPAGNEDKQWSSLKTLYR